VEAASRDDTLAEVHALSGVLRGTVDFDWVGAEQEFRRALELNPASPIVRYDYGFWFLRPMGRLDEALSELRRAAVELDPLSAMFNTLLAYLYYTINISRSALCGHSCRQPGCRSGIGKTSSLHRTVLSV
jgi:adenylate cyclase